MNPRLILPLVGVLALAACSQQALPPAQPPVVKFLIVGNSVGDTARSYSGEVRARYEMPLSFRIPGKLLERKVDAGAHVVAGQLLARLDPADAALQSAQAQSQLALAEAEAKRYRDLRARNYVSAAVLDAKETALKSAASQAGVAKNQLAYAQLTADGAGVIVAVLAEPGQVVAAGQPVLRLAQDGEREVQIALPETAFGEVRVGGDANVTLWSANKTYRGCVREIVPAADAASRTFATRVSVLDADPALALGMTATVRFAASAAPVPTIPMTALYQQGNDVAVWVVGADDVLALRPVKVAAYTDGGAAIADGLKAGERIVAAGVHRLAAGQKVRLAQ